ncbi:acyl carrier protein [Coralloluteibacterium stylophorae]|uniref:Acyl carrier protein n=1 Tax=Coralloluteibacterium stylophorae TaxID=1776034 RepID=A0A8J7VUL1_9GAMM|nr:acyl carrier protein [Coralloluteibacterium stylophorae]MBS7457369.1 acyl carrier protein [Coralloluteibacterium stylophorae]
MTHAEIMRTLEDIFRDVLDDDAIELTRATQAGDIDGWDSQAHVSLIVAAEMRFGVRFRTAELDGLHDVGAFADLIHQKLASA